MTCFITRIIIFCKPFFVLDNYPRAFQNGFSPSKKICIYLLDGSLIKMIKMLFYFILIGLLVLKIFKLLSWLYFSNQAVFLHDQKSQDKSLNISRTKRAFKAKWKPFFIIFLSLAKYVSDLWVDLKVLSHKT